ncbi:MAG: sodium/glutamate symporter [Rubripirellula sp.]
MAVFTECAVWLVALGVAAWLLKMGALFRSKIQFFQRFHIPASVIAGVVGWIVLNDVSRAETLLMTDSLWTEHLSQVFGVWPGWLIAFVFAGMLLKPIERREKGGGRLARVGREGLMVWVIVLGQTTVGLLVTWLLIKPFFDVPNSFGMLIETGFAGGHGTAAAMGQVFAHPAIQLSGGTDLGVLVATVGLVYGLATGMFWVNLGYRRGWVRKRVADAEKTEGHPQAIQFNATPSVDIFRWMRCVCLLAIAVGLGLALHRCAVEIATGLDQVSLTFDSPQTVEDSFSREGEPDSGEVELAERLGMAAVIGSFPLFIFTLFGGYILQKYLALAGMLSVIDSKSLRGVTSLAMDVLVFAAISTLNIETVKTFFGPLLILLIAGFIWTGFCLLFLSRRLLPQHHWFELGLLNYGMSTGTTATGFVLLRLVDPKLETGAAEDYALAAPLSSPFIGGGMFTIGLPLVILERYPLEAICVPLVLLVSVLIAVGWIWNQRAVDRSSSG